MSQSRPLFVLFSSFSHFSIKYSFNFNIINWKSIDGEIGIRTPWLLDGRRRLNHGAVAVTWTTLRFCFQSDSNQDWMGVPSTGGRWRRLRASLAAFLFDSTLLWSVSIIDITSSRLPQQLSLLPPSLTTKRASFPPIWTHEIGAQVW